MRHSVCQKQVSFNPNDHAIDYKFCLDLPRLIINKVHSTVHYTGAVFHMIILGKLIVSNIDSKSMVFCSVSTIVLTKCSSRSHMHGHMKTTLVYSTVLYSIASRVSLIC